MKTSTIGRRRASTAVLAAALAIGTGIATAGAASAAPHHNGHYGSGGTPRVTQGLPNQAAGNLTYVFHNVYDAHSHITFTIQGNDCTNAQDEVVGFTKAPSVSVQTIYTYSHVTAPTATVRLTSSPGCGKVGVKDQAVVELNNGERSQGENDSYFQLKLSGIAYTVGDNAPAGSQVMVTANATDTNLPDPTPATRANAVVTDRNYAFANLTAMRPSTNGGDLGTVKVHAAPTNQNIDLLFQPGFNKVTLQLDSGATFTPNVVPDIKVPAGYHIFGPKVNGKHQNGTPKTHGHSSSYSFWVYAPPTDVLKRGATIMISGLKANVDSDVDSVYLTTWIKGNQDPQATSYGPSAAINVLNYNNRVGGATRFDTAAKMFNTRFGPHQYSVVLSRGWKFPDALSANFLAATQNTGILLTWTNTLPQATKNALLENCVRKVYVTGGPDAVSPGVVNQIRSMQVCGAKGSPNLIVKRLAGPTRYGTNKAINEFAWHEAQPNLVLMATGENFPDALALGPVGYANELPLILTNGKRLTQGVKSQLSDFNPTAVVIAGGTDVVSHRISAKLRHMGYHVVRLAGKDRTQTAEEVAMWSTYGFGPKVNNGMRPQQLLDASTVAIARGDAFPDALTGGPYAGAAGYPVLLTWGPNRMGQGTPAFLSTRTVGTQAQGVANPTSELEALGLSDVLPPSQLFDGAVSISPQPRPIQP